ncbi:MAG: site-2 protease family protein [Clostridiaceae bacterium]|nr:site-2 protease family protein [Clostridiaceae bacterium]
MGLLAYILRIPVVLLAIIVHEVSHGYVSYLLGDPTAKMSGRLTFNPFSHLDPFGALCMVLFRFGWAKPVPINPIYYKNRKLGMFLVSFAGPFSNFIMAFLATFIYVLIGRITDFNFALSNIIQILLVEMVFVNIGLGLFNLIPFPPLDGFKIVSLILPQRIYYQILEYERFGFILLIILVYLGTFSNFLTKALYGMLHFFEFVANSILFFL